MTQDNLKPCPFCGASAEIEDFSTSYRPNARPLWAVACTNNACLSEAMRALEDREAVVTAWNTRTIERLSPPLDGEGVELFTLDQIEEAYEAWRAGDVPQPFMKMMRESGWFMAGKQGRLATLTPREQIRAEALETACKQLMDALRSGTIEDEGRAHEAIRSALSLQDKT